MTKKTSSGGKRWIVISDNHGDQADEKAVAEMFGFLRYWKPEIRIHAGDCFDFRPLRKKASDTELREGKADDVAMGLDLLRRFKPTHFVRGNHDERLWDLCDPQKNDDGQKREAAVATAEEIHRTLKEVGCAHIYPYHKRLGVCDVGKLRVVHGYTTGVYAARKMADVYGACLFGHIHRIEQFTAPRLSREIARSIGCLCKLDMDYNRAHVNTLAQEHGFAYGTMTEDGRYQFYQAMPVNGSWSFPTEWRGQ